MHAYLVVNVLGTLTQPCDTFLLFDFFFQKTDKTILSLTVITGEIIAQQIGLCKSVVFPLDSNGHKKT